MTAAPRAVRTLADLVDRLAEHRGDRPAIIALGDDDVLDVDGRELADRVVRAAAGLAARGIGRGDAVAILAAPSIAWIVASLAIVRAGAVAVPLDTQMDQRSLAGVLADCGATRILADRRARERLASVDHDATIIALDRARADTAPADGERRSANSDAHDAGSEDRAEPFHRWIDDGAGDLPDLASDDPAFLLYTSGTTGEPKGVPLTHRQLTHQFRVVRAAELLHGDRMLVPLPLHHVYPLVHGVLAPLAVGCCVVLPYAMTGPELLRAAREGRASVVVAVPRVYEALVDGVERRLASAGRLVGGVVRAAISGCGRVRRRFGLRVGRWLFGPLRRRIGPELRMVVSGGSELPPPLARKLAGLGFDVVSGYGLTETAPLLTLNPPDAPCPDSVGRPVTEVELRIDPRAGGEQRLESEARGRDAPSPDDEHSPDEANPIQRAARSADAADDRDVEADDASGGDERNAEAAQNAADDERRRPNPDADAPDTESTADDREGEILARGPCVFGGYHDRDDDTADAFTDDGWFRTGDLGRIDEHGCLFVTGRRSTRLVGASGENIRTEHLERHYAEHDDIDEIGLLSADGRLAAVAVPAASAREQEQDTGEVVRGAIRARARDLPSYQRPDVVVWTRSPLDRTRLGKLRRHRLAERFDELRSGGEDERRTEPIAVADMRPADQELVAAGAGRQVWDLVADRFADRGPTPDSHLQTDLGLDSLGWLDLGVEISRRTGVELDRDRIAEIETVRDLLEAVVAERGASQDGARRSPFDDPKSFIDERERRWLEPLPWIGRWLARAAEVVLRATMRVVWRLEVRGLEHLPTTGAVVFTPNHESYLDPFALAAALPTRLRARTYWGGWTGIAFHNPLARACSRIARIVPVARDRDPASSLAFATLVLRQDEHLVWFPEGERSPDGELHEFRPGIGMLLDHHDDVRAVPVRIDGAFEAWPRGQRLPRPGRIRITFGEPVAARTLADRGSGDEARTRIADALRTRVEQLGDGSVTRDRRARR